MSYKLLRFDEEHFTVLTASEEVPGHPSGCPGYPRDTSRADQAGAARCRGRRCHRRAAGTAERRRIRPDENSRWKSTQHPRQGWLDSSRRKETFGETKEWDTQQTQKSSLRFQPAGKVSLLEALRTAQPWRRKQTARVSPEVWLSSSHQNLLCFRIRRWETK